MRSFQPIGTDDPRLDFYTMCKREATEYDIEYVKEYDEDLNTIPIFVRCSSSVPVNYLTRSCRRACSLLSAPLSPSMSIRAFNQIPISPPAHDPAHSQSIRCPQRGSRRSTYSGRSTVRDHHCHWAHACDFSYLSTCRVRCYAGQAMAEPILAGLGWINDRALRRQSTQMRWAREVAIKSLRRESPSDAPSFPPRLPTLQTRVLCEQDTSSPTSPTSGLDFTLQLLLLPCHRMRVRSKHWHRLLPPVHGGRSSVELSPPPLTPSRCSHGPTRRGTRESIRSSAPNPY